MASRCKIRRIELQNFKSYEGKHLIDLSLDFTAIVGPGSSGKSNLVDAIKFVLGGLSVDQKLIHESGAGERARMASVKLFVNNGVERSFTRTITRDGGEEYVMDEATVDRNTYCLRLQDLRVLVKAGDSRVFQGNWEDVVSINGRELAMLLEQISASDVYPQSTYEDLEQQKIDAVAKRETASTELKTIVENQTQLIEKLAQCYSGSISKIDSEVMKATEELDEKLKELEKKESEKRGYILEIEGLRDDSGSSKDHGYEVGENKEIQDKLNAILASIEAMQGELQKHGGSQDATLSATIELLKDKFPGVESCITDICTPVGKYRCAVTVAMDVHMDAVIVDNRETGTKCMEYLRSIKHSPMTFIDRSHAHKKEQAPSNEGAKHIIDVIRHDSKYADAILAAVGNTRVCDTIEEASETARKDKCRVVTVDGTLVTSDGLTGGSSSRLDAMALRWGRKETEGLPDEEWSRKISEREKELQLLIDGGSDGMKTQHLKNKCRLATSIIGHLKAEVEIAKLDAERTRLEKERDVFLERKKKLESAMKKELATLQEGCKERCEKKMQELETQITLEGKRSRVAEETCASQPHPKRRRVDSSNQPSGPVYASSATSPPESNGPEIEIQQISSELRDASKKLEDHTAAVEKLKNTLKSVDLEMVARLRKFNDAFRSISGTFDQIYKQLTPPEGGNASLQLGARKDLSLPEIKYSVGSLAKDQQSNRNQAAAGLALLFSIRSYRPSPFYVIDGVDAILDDAKAATVFGAKRREGECDSQQSLEENGFQSIVISQKQTFHGVADALVAVYMDEAGCSKTLTMDLKPFQESPPIKQGSLGASNVWTCLDV